MNLLKHTAIVPIIGYFRSVKPMKLDAIEVGALAGLMALTSDLVWVVHDVVVNGMSVWYGCVGTGLSLALLVTGAGWVQHVRARQNKLTRVRNRILNHTRRCKLPK